MALIRSFRKTCKPREDVTSGRRRTHRLRSPPTTRKTEGRPAEMTDTSAGFFGTELGVPAVPPYLLEEQKEVEGPEMDIRETEIR